MPVPVKMVPKRTFSIASLDGIEPRVEAKRPRLVIRNSTPNPLQQTAVVDTLVSDRNNSVSTISTHPTTDDEDANSESDIFSVISETSEEDLDCEEDSTAAQKDQTVAKQALLLNQTRVLQSRLADWEASPVHTNVAADEILAGAQQLSSRLAGYLDLLASTASKKAKSSSSRPVMPKRTPLIKDLPSTVFQPSQEPIPFPQWRAFPVFSDSSDSECSPPRPYGMKKQLSELGSFDDEPDVMRHLLGVKRAKEHPSIDELEDLSKSFEATYPCLLSRSVSRCSSVCLR